MSGGVCRGVVHGRDGVPTQGEWGNQRGGANLCLEYQLESEFSLKRRVQN